MRRRPALEQRGVAFELLIAQGTQVFRFDLDGLFVLGLTESPEYDVLDVLDAAVDGCINGRFDAMVTAPVHKGIINDAGVPFTGHTEYLAERTGARLPVMMLVGGGLRVALATTHLPLAEVSAAITAERLPDVLTILDADLKSRFGIVAPRILV